MAERAAGTALATAKRLLSHYFEMSWEEWHPDNQDEIEQSVDAIVDAAVGLAEARMVTSDLRDQFAAAALAGLLSSPIGRPKENVQTPSAAAALAFEYADAMLARRAK